MRSPRLRYRRYTPADAEELHALWGLPGVRRYLFDDEMMPLQWVRNEILRDAATIEEEGCGQWALLAETGDAIIGFTGFRRFEPLPHLQLVYALHPDHWGQGLAAEAARTMVHRAFNELEFERVWASTDPPNEASVRVMRRIGMREVARTERLLTYAIDRGFQRDYADAHAAATLEHNPTADALRMLGRAEEALAQLRKEPDTTANRLRLGIALQYLGEHAEGEEEMRRAFGGGLDDFVWQHLGKCLVEQGRPDEAVTCFERALELRRDADLIASTRRALDALTKKGRG